MPRARKKQPKPVQNGKPRVKHRKTARGIALLEDCPAVVRAHNGAMDDALTDLGTDIVSCDVFENMLRGRPPAAPQPTLRCLTAGDRADIVPKPVGQVLGTVLEVCQAARKRRHHEMQDELSEMSHERLSQLARFTHNLDLMPYNHFLHYVPRLVNVVTLAEALPVEGSGIKLPLDLHAIASKCTGAFYAPRRFAAVQLAFSNPRCRVLIFHTGRLVGTGASTH